MSIALKTANLRNLQRIWNSVRVKGTPYYENVLLDFTSSRISFRGQQTIVKGDLQYSTDDSQNVPAQMFIDGGKFFSLVQLSDEITIDNEGVFHTDSSNGFSIPSLNEDDIDMADQPYDDWTNVIVPFTEETRKILSSAIGYIDPTDADSIWSQAVYIQNGHIITASHYKMLFGEIGGSDEGSFAIPAPLARILPYLNLDGDVDFLIRKGAGDSTVIQIQYGDIWLRYYCSNSYETPGDLLSEEFTSSYFHENYIDVDLASLSNTARFLLSYFSDVPLLWATFTFNTQSEAPELKLILKYSSGKTEYSLPILECSDAEYFEGKEIMLGIDSIRNDTAVLAGMGVSRFRMRVDVNASSIMFADGEGKSKVYLVNTLFEDN